MFPDDLNALATTLEQALPPAHRAQAASLAAVLTAPLSGSAVVIEPLQFAALQSLVGQSLTLSSAQVAIAENAQTGDITIRDVVGGNKITLHISSPLSVRPVSMSSLPPEEQRYRRLLLRQVRSTIMDRLRAYLDGCVPVAINLRWQPDDLPARSRVPLQQITVSPVPLPAGIGLHAAFEVAAGSLLVLGAPGSGKTTLLLELCNDLLSQAESDDVAAVPVVFELASWTAADVPLDSWMVAQLTAPAYAMTWTQAQRLVASDGLVPLFDGLDEVARADRGRCVDAINTFRAAHYVPLVVTARTEAYDMLLQRLRVQQAVLVEPLTEVQLERALSRYGEVAKPLLAELESDETLRKLLNTPLMMRLALQILSSNYDEAATYTWRTVTLLNLFIQSSLQYHLPFNSIGRVSTLRRLRWIAKRLGRERTFYIEHLQPKDSAEGWARRLYRWTARFLQIAVLIVAAIIANFVALIVAAPLLHWLSPAPPITMPYLITAALISSGIMGGVSTFVALIGGVANEDPIHLVTRLRWSPTAIKDAIWEQMQVFVRLYSSKVVAPVVLILCLLLACTNLSGQFITGLMLIGWIVVGLPGFAMLAGIVRGIYDDDVVRLRRPNEGIIASARTSMLVWVIASILFTLLVAASVLTSTPKLEAGGVVLNTFLTIAFGCWISVGLALVFGGQVVIKHWAVRLTLWLSSVLPFRLPAFLDACVERTLLRRVGGGYEFFHGLLQEHIAELSDAEIVHLAYGTERSRL